MTTTTYSSKVERVHPVVSDTQPTIHYGRVNEIPDQYKKSSFFVNKLSFPIGILTALNEVIILNPITTSNVYRAHSNNCFSIVERREWAHGKVRFDTKQLFSVRDAVVGVENDYFDVLDDSVRRMEETSRYGDPLIAEIAVEVHGSRINSLKRPLYIKEANIVIFNASEGMGLPEGFRHPLSDANKLLVELDQQVIEDEDEDSMILKAHGVSNGQNTKPLYVNLAENLFELPIRESNITSEEGVYITQIGACNDVREDGKLQASKIVKHYTFDEAREQFGFYESKLDAMNHHDKVANKYKLRNQEMAQELAELKHKLEKESREISTQHLKEDLAVKQAYYSNHYDRKDSSEIIGWIPKIVTGVVATVAAVWSIGKVFAAASSGFGAFFSIF